MGNTSRLIGIITTIINICIVLSTNAQPSSNQNYVLMNVVKQSGITNEAQVNGLAIMGQGKSQSITYFDGLGRPLQAVATQASASGKDIITPFVYDSFGRETKKYLPYVETGATGGFGSYQPGWSDKQSSFYTGGLQGVDTTHSPFTQMVLESSPLNRVLAQGAAGTVWQPNISDPYDTNRKVIKLKYEINVSQDSVRIFTVDSAGNIASPGFYPGGELTIRTTIDEHNGVIKEFTDKSGHLILKRIFLTTDSIQTYNIYDDYDLLRAVIQPAGVKAITGSSWTPPSGFIDKWVFLFRYDGRNRMVMKKVPGADSIVTIYDQWDRVVLNQDGNLRRSNSWLFTKYDRLSRPVITGSYTDTRSIDSLRNVLDSSSGRYEIVNTSVDEGYTLNHSFPSSTSFTLSLYTISHYDSYDSLPSWKSNYIYYDNIGGVVNNPYVIGQVVATQKNIINSTNWLRGLVYFDDKYRAIVTQSDNIAGGIDFSETVRSFDGKITEQMQVPSSAFYNSYYLVADKKYNYDQADRLLQLIHSFDPNGNHRVYNVLLSDNTYNELGNLLSKKLDEGNYGRPNYLQKLDYSYNVRGFLNGINQPCADGAGYDESDLFNLALHYNTTTIDSAEAQYNGNVAEELWKGGYDESLRGYRYTYDKANRLLQAVYGFKSVNSSSQAWDFSTRYDEQIKGYDPNGNIQGIKRYHGTLGKIDDLYYSNWDGNKLLNVVDSVTTVLPVGFNYRNSGGNGYHYDASGNQTYDYNKHIDSIHYNFLDLPDTITVAGKGGIRFIYDAAGNKLQKTITDTTITPAKITTYKYAGDFVYKNDTVELINHEEGRLRPMKIDTTQPFSGDNMYYVYDYFLKDNLGNVRMVITPESKTNLYAATMETAAAGVEEQLFTNVSSTRTTKPSGFDTDTSNKEVARLNGDISISSNHRVGPSLVLKVMAGDTVTIGTKVWYQGATQPPPSGLSPIADELVSLFAGGIAGVGGTHGGTTPQTSISDWIAPLITDFLDSTQSYNSSQPKAFLNWYITDEEFKKVNSANHLGAVQVPAFGTGDTSKLLVGPVNMVVRRNGYLYAFTSNESNQNVYFDNIIVNHKSGPVLEQSEYYAFGLEIPGLSSHAYTTSSYANNRYKFNGKEIQSQEFKDSTGLDWEDFGARMYDPQTGRMCTMDPHVNKYQGWTPYNYAFDNPIIIADPSGKDGEVIYKEGKGTKKDPNVITIKANYYYNKNTLSGEQVDALNSTISDYNGTETTVKDKDGKYTVIKYDLSAQGLDNDEAVEKAATGDTFTNSKGGTSRFGNVITAGDGPKTSESEGNGPPFGEDHNGKTISLYNNNIEAARAAGYSVKTILENTLNHEIGHNLGGEHGDPSPMNFKMTLSELPNSNCMGCKAAERNVPFEHISKDLAPTLLDRINNFVGRKYIKYRADAQPPNP